MGGPYIMSKLKQIGRAGDIYNVVTCDQVELLKKDL